MKNNLQVSHTDSIVTLKSIILFSVLTVLNISVFVFMVFENQMELIAKNAELVSKDKGIAIKIKVEEIVSGQGLGGARQQYRVEVPEALVYQDRDIRTAALDTLRKDEIVLSDYEIAGWSRIVYRANRTGWLISDNLVRHLSPRERGKLEAADIRLILDILSAEGIKNYSVLLENGYFLMDTRGRQGELTSKKEINLIKKAIFKNSFENLAFTHKVKKKEKSVDLYIPIYYGPDKLVVLRPTVPLHYVWQQTGLLYRQCIIIGLLVLIVHVLFVLINQKMIIRPMVLERTHILSSKNKEIQDASDKLQVAYNSLNNVHSQIQSELDKARKIQLSLIPESIPQFPGYSFDAIYFPASKVGGDLYDFYRIDKDNIGIVITDASGHGIPAALVVSMAKLAFSRHAQDQLSSATVLKSVNEELVTFFSLPFILY
jgi:cellobiose-specific phosphotransferase system component IIA